MPSGTTDKDLDNIFGHYDESGDGQLDYKEFSRVLDAKQQGFLKFASDAKSAPQQSDNQAELKHMMQLFRDRIKARGARGIIGLQRMFKIMDDDNSHALSLQEFAKACRDFKIGISDEYLPTIFNAFDLNHDGTLNIDEFLMAVRGDLNQTRIDIVEKAFKKLDKDGNGFVEYDDIKDIYSADRHPDVIQGKKTKQQVLNEFLETFET